MKKNEPVTVHHSKFALAKHPWDAPLKTERELSDKYGLNVKTPQIGDVVYLKMNNQENTTDEGI